MKLPTSTIDELAREMVPPEDARTTFQRRQVGVRVGEIVATTSPTVTIKFAGDPDTELPEISRLASYTPTIGDVVFCLVWDSVVLVLGKEA
jgi:hypothetical protein